MGMKHISKYWILFLILAGFLCAGTSVVCGETPSPAEANLARKVENLTRILDAMEELSSEITETRQELNGPEGKGREDLLSARISQLNRKLFDLESNFNELASEVSPDSIDINREVDFDLGSEIKDILGPLVREIKRATSRPREIERYRSDIEGFNQQLQVIHRAIIHLRALSASPGSTPRLRDHLDQTLSFWESKQNEIETLKSISRLQLEKLSGETESLSDTIKSLPKIFFRSHGSNFLLSLSALFLVAFLLFRLHRLIKKISPFHKEQSTFYVRVFDLAYGLFAAFISMSTMLGVLYSMSDWVLLSLILVFLLGLAWTSKEALPRFWNQARLILNLGPVREGELVVYKGVPYKVLSINVFTYIYNPAFPCGKIRLPIADLLDLRSRPITANEPWFPSMENDWVLLDTEHVARIACQTPETVIAEMIGGAKTTFTTEGYLGATPVNLSSGFRIKVLFGLDYSLQGIITGKVPAVLKESIEGELYKSGFRESLLFIRSDFKQAASSSLDIEISVDFDGSSARDYVQIKRLIQKACVESCNKENWVIPFNQITVHMDRHDS